MNINNNEKNNWTKIHLLKTKVITKLAMKYVIIYTIKDVFVKI